MWKPLDWWIGFIVFFVGSYCSVAVDQHHVVSRDTSALKTIVMIGTTQHTKHIFNSKSEVSTDLGFEMQISTQIW